MKGPMSRMVTTSGAGDHWGPTDPQTFQAIASVLSYHPETDGKTLLKRHHLLKSHNVKKPIGGKHLEVSSRMASFHGPVRCYVC